MKKWYTVIRVPAVNVSLNVESNKFIIFNCLIPFYIFQIRKMKGLKQKKAHLNEIHINGGDVGKKDVGKKFFIFIFQKLNSIPF